MQDPIVIIGGGMAGGNAAATLRDEGFSGPVVLHQQGTECSVRTSSAVQDLPAL